QIGGVGGTEDVGVHGAAPKVLPVGVGGLGEGVRQVHGGVVDQDVQVIDRCQHPGEQVGSGLRVGKVGLEQEVPLAGQVGECVLGLFPSSVVIHDHPVPVLCEGGGDRPADTSGSACHQDVACLVRCGSGFWTVMVWRRHGGILARCGFLPWSAHDVGPTKG